MSLMDLVVKIRLLPTPEQEALLRELLASVNSACDYISLRAFATKVFSHFKLCKLAYRDVKSKFSLGATMSQLAARKVSSAYKLGKKSIRRFKPLGSISLNLDVFSYKKNNQVSIWTKSGRILVEFILPPNHKDLQLSSKKEAKLVLQGDQFYLHQIIDHPAPETKPSEDFLGVDLGIKNIAYDSQGERFSGAHVNNLRRRNLKLRRRLQKKGTKSARRLLKKRSGRERRFATDVNHRISKKLVAKVKDTSHGIAIENLKGIRERGITANKTLRRDLHSWSFYQLRSFLTYKCEMAGVRLVVVSPAYTSVTCPSCGSRNKKNRATRNRFKCVQCGFAGHADHIAAVNIVAKARNVNGRAVSFQPNAAESS
jgi:IS605 OrfB family transposase